MSGIGAFGPGISTRRRVFVSYHHAGDQAYYNAFSRTFHDTYQLISDTSLERRIDSDNVDYVLRRIREDFITGSSCTIVLVGNSTWGRKYVDWEIDATLQKEHGLIGVQLPTLVPMSNGLYRVPDRLHDNINSGYAVWTSWATITAGPQALVNLIETANGRSSLLIDNSRARRYRNA
jgi:hypothetical protein